jgi:hypothetical protein
LNRKLLISLLIVLTAILAGCAGGGARVAPLTPDDLNFAGRDLYDKYKAALGAQSESLRNTAMKVEFEAQLPKLKKKGTMNALRRISDLGKVTYKVLGFEGDNTVKKEVIARYMTAETEAAQTMSEAMAIAPENYKFKYRGLQERDGRSIHIFELKPRAKRVGLFKGELWIDSETFLPVREQGEFVKSPSLFIKNMQFVRTYETANGVAFVKRLHSRTDTRIVGTAELNIIFESPQPQEAAADVASATSAKPL